jgi:hypothetical protein
MRLPSVFAPGPRLRIFAAITIASAAVISFESLKHLAEYAGFGHFAWLFPATLDAVAAFGMDLWVTRSPAWKQARALALAAIGGSLIGNIADHWISQGTVLPAVLGAVPPGMLAALLAVLHRHASGTAVHRSGPDMAVRDAVWSTLPQAAPSRSVGTGPQTYMVPVRVWSLDQAAGLQGPAVGPMLRDRTGASAFADRLRAEELAHAVQEDRKAAGPVQRTSAPRQARTGGPADDVVVKAIRAIQADTGRWPSKLEVMREHAPMGSGRALKLINLAKAPEETHG